MRMGTTSPTSRRRREGCAVTARSAAGLMLVVAMFITSCASSSSSSEAGSGRRSSTTAGRSGVTVAGPATTAPPTSGDAQVLPDLTGLSVLTALERLRAIGFTAVGTDDASGKSRSVPADDTWRVVGQSYPAGVLLSRATDLLLFARPNKEGSETIDVPGFAEVPADLPGDKADVRDVLDELSGLGFTSISLRDVGDGGRRVDIDAVTSVMGFDPPGGSIIPVAQPLTVLVRQPLP